jgi:hypothetical protein
MKITIAVTLTFCFSERKNRNIAMKSYLIILLVILGLLGLESIIYGLIRHAYEFVWVGIGILVFALSGSSYRPSDSKETLKSINISDENKEQSTKEKDRETIKPPFVIAIDSKDEEPTFGEKNKTMKMYL